MGHLLGSRDYDIVIERAQDFGVRPERFADLAFDLVALDGGTASLESDA
jgi:hypothetical protein